MKIFMECFMTKLVNILKKPLAVAGLLSIALASGVASADFNPKFYVGAGVDYAKYSVPVSKYTVKVGPLSGEAKVKHGGFGLVVPVIGMKFNENFGLEAGYSLNKKVTIKYNGILGDSTEEICKVRNAYLDFMGYMPVTEQVDLIGGIGIGRFMAKKGKDINLPDGVKFKNQFGVRVKAGAQYNFNNNIGIRGLVSYQSGGAKLTGNQGSLWPLLGKTENRIIKGMATFGLAATYTF